MRPVVGASNSVESCCCRSRLRSSRPNRAIRNSGIGDNGLGADTLFSDGVREKIIPGVGCVAAVDSDPLYRDASSRPAGPPATRTPPSVKQPGLHRASSPDQTFASHKLPLNSNRGGGGNLVRGGGLAKDCSDHSHKVGVGGCSAGASE
jgi:hypothetical protein